MQVYLSIIFVTCPKPGKSARVIENAIFIRGILIKLNNVNNISRYCIIVYYVLYAQLEQPFTLIGVLTAKQKQEKN